MSDHIEHSHIETNGVTLHVAQAGPPDGDPIVLLHGFPEFWFGWSHQIPALAAAGYRVIVPDQRGYNLSDKPKGLANYTLDKLAEDIIGLIDALGYEKVKLVVHDWGGAVGWWLVSMYPDRFEKFAALNIPHNSVFRRNLAKNAEQRKRSWYMFMFQIPLLPDLFFGKLGGFRLMIEKTSRRGVFSESELQEYDKAWSQKGAARGMLAWYRASFQKKSSSNPPREKVKVPTMIIWGVKDVAFLPDSVEQSAALCEDVRVETFDHATHWVQHDEPDAVNKLLVEFFGETP